MGRRLYRRGPENMGLLKDPFMCFQRAKGDDKGLHLEESAYLEPRSHVLCSGLILDHPGET